MPGHSISDGEPQACPWGAHSTFLGPRGAEEGRGLRAGDGEGRTLAHGRAVPQIDVPNS